MIEVNMLLSNKHIITDVFIDNLLNIDYYHIS